MPLHLREVVRASFPSNEPWEPVSRGSLIGWLVFYGLFLVHALADRDGFLLLDHVNLIAHEGGHLLFSWLGATPALYGGTLLQFFVPLALTVYFWRERKPAAVAFTLFWVFENCLYTSVYLGDARAQVLPLVTVGDPEFGGHDWFQILSRWGLLRHDKTLAGLVRAAGWLGLLAAPAWLVYRHRQDVV